jgi:hypothetical protein
MATMTTEVQGASQIVAINFGRQDVCADKQSLDVQWAALVHRWPHLVAIKAKIALLGIYPPKEVSTN